VIAWHRVRAVARKEWLEIKASRVLVSGAVILPLLFLALSSGILVTIGKKGQTAKDLDKLPAVFKAMSDDPHHALYFMLVLQFAPMFLIIPTIIPSQLATQAIVREREARSLEVLLASPLTTAELVVGKTLGCALPGLVPGILAYAVYVLVASLICPAPVWRVLAAPAWILAFTLAAPLISILSVQLGLIVSSRTTDQQTAQSIAGILVLPIVGLTMSQVFGVVLTVPYVLGIVAVVLPLVLVASIVAVGAFERETILVRMR
jgi:ABC-2 type transport system permease protein